jgi:predicted signal transduction protein with EAL and GGDEF domain
MDREADLLAVDIEGLGLDHDPVRRLLQHDVFHGRQVVMHASIGAAVTSDSTTEPDDLLRQADLAMYNAKTSGKGRFAFYEPQMHAAAVTRMELKADLERAIADRDFELHYQPIVDLRDGRVTGVEALLRWRHPERGLVLPAEFIPIAEETGLIVTLGSWVVDTAASLPLGPGR